MSHRIDREEFLQTLNLISPGLSTRDWLEQSTCVVVNNGWCSTFNDEICCRAKSSLPTDIKGAVYASELIQTLEKMPDAEIVVSRRKDGLRVRGKLTDVTVGMESTIHLPVEQVEPPGEWTTLPTDFGEAVELVVAGAGSDDEEFLSVCAHIHPDYMESTDRRQMIRYLIRTGVGESFLVRAKSLLHTHRLKPIRMGTTDNWVHFDNGSKEQRKKPDGTFVRPWAFSCRRHTDPFPTETLTRALQFKGSPTVLPRGAELGADIASTFSRDDKKNDRVSVKLTDGWMVVRGKNMRGRGIHNVPMKDYRGEDLVFKINPASLVTLVNKEKKCEIGDGKLKMCGDGWTYLTVLDNDDDWEKEDAEDADADPEPVVVGEEDGDE